jgi:hypothetical protein
MKYYNEAKSERAIRRKAMFFTFALSFILASAAFFVFTDSGRDILPDQMKEWFQKEAPKSPIDKPEKA